MSSAATPTSASNSRVIRPVRWRPAARHEHAAQAGLGDDAEDTDDPVREVIQEGPVVERRAELPTSGPAIPELGVLHCVQRPADDVQASPTFGVTAELVVAAKVNDGADTMLVQCRPASAVRRSRASEQTTVPQRVSRPSAVPKPPRSRTLKRPSQSRHSINDHGAGRPAGRLSQGTNWRETS
jgi:hypothetical protein